jgi:hypothetical protein
MKMFSSKLFTQKKLVVCFALVALVLFVSSVTAMARMEKPPRMLLATPEENCQPVETAEPNCYYSGGCYYCTVCICDDDGEPFCFEYEVCEDAVEKAMGDSIDKTAR